VRFFTVANGLISHCVCLALVLCSLISLGCRNSKEDLRKPLASKGARENRDQGSDSKEKNNASKSPSEGHRFELAQELDHVYRNGQDQDRFSILESLGGGVGMLDYDVDGQVDLCFAGGGTFGENDSLTPASTCLQRSVLTTGQALSYVDRSSESGIAASTIYSHGIAVADYDNDGFPDVLVTGYGGLMLWHNCGDGTFEEVSNASDVKSTSWSSSAAWGDLNNDGYVDLYVVNYVDWSFAKNPICKSSKGLRDVCPPRDFEGLPDLIFLNAGDGGFSEASQQFGLRRDGKGLGVVLADLNNDSWLDVYVANDTSANFLYLNQNGQRFEESAELRGVAYDERGVPNGSMGVDILDFNSDGLPDIGSRTTKTRRLLFIEMLKTASSYM
jgi:enediyne biosynthesis protein E4